jgi:hypothetical protein
VAPDGQGPVTLACPGSALHDGAGNPLAAAHATVTFDTIDPGVVITPNGAATAANPIVFTLTCTFSVPLTTLTSGAMSNSGASVASPSGGGALYQLSVTAQDAPGSMTITVPAGAVSDMVGNPLAGTTFTLPITDAAGAGTASASPGSTTSPSSTCGLGGAIASLGLLGVLLVRRRWPTGGGGALGA